jgi:hypothetical protein
VIRRNTRTFDDVLALWEATPDYVDPPDDRAPAGTSPKPSLPTSDAPSGEGGSDVEPITNYELSFDNGKPKAMPLSMSEVINRIYAATDGWPRRIGKQLFYDDPEHGICRFQKPDQLFGWLWRYGPPDWKQAANFVSESKVFAELARTSHSYAWLEVLPHYPPLPGHYYCHPQYQPGNGATISELLDRFCPASEMDRYLILAMFASVVWGGGGGSRPAFVVVSDAGHGVGKSRLIETMSEVFGSEPFRIKQGEPAEKIATRILTAGTEAKRIVLLDNVKTDRVSWADLESFITAKEIGGHGMYLGEGSRPNNLLWCITLNGPAMSRDMAQRSVIVKLAKPKYGGAWERDTRRFISEHRTQLICDLAGFFEQPRAILPRYSRWGEWEENVLARMPGAAEIQAVICERQGLVDADGEESSVVEDHFRHELERLNYAPDEDSVHIPNAIAREWYGAAIGAKVTTNGMTRAIKQAIGEGRLTRLTINPSHANGRGLLWIADSDEPLKDLEERMNWRSK